MEAEVHMEVERRLRTAHEIIKLVSKWLSEDDASGHAFLEPARLEACAS
jgi:hypothetical protein